MFNSLFIIILKDKTLSKMKQLFIVTTVCLFIVIAPKMTAQTYWNGPSITFSKASHADWTLEENQDRITDNVWLTRADNSLHFNIVVNPTYSALVPAPVDTEWAIGSISDGISSLTFDVFLNTVTGNNGLRCPPCGLNVPMVLHLITDDIYIDLTFTSWNEETTAPLRNAGGFGAAGGEFTYQRSTSPALGLTDFNKSFVKIAPNPSRGFIQVTGITQTENYTIYNLLGLKVGYGKVSKDEKINIQNLKQGVYLLKLHKGSLLKFMKQ